jgi:hypothetical protein
MQHRGMSIFKDLTTYLQVNGAALGAADDWITFSQKKHYEMQIE